MSLLDDIVEWIDETVDELVELVIETMGAVADWLGKALGGLFGRVLRWLTRIPGFGERVRAVLLWIRPNGTTAYDIDEVGATARAAGYAMNEVTNDKLQELLSRTPAYSHDYTAATGDERRAIDEARVGQRIFTVEA
jgi:hypothetical protein